MSLEEILQFGEHRVRVVGTYDDPWFCGNDVARALGYAQPRDAVLYYVRERDRRRLEDISVRIIPPRIEYHERESIYINRSGLYKLTFSSKLPIAEVFTDWVTSEVLPTIERTGKFILRERNRTAMITHQHALADAQARVADLATRLDARERAFDDLQRSTGSLREDVADVSATLRVATHDRAPLPDDHDKREEFHVLRWIGDDAALAAIKVGFDRVRRAYLHEVIRGQTQHCADERERRVLEARRRVWIEQPGRELDANLELVDRFPTANARTLFNRCRPLLRNLGVKYTQVGMDLSASALSEAQLCALFHRVHDERLAIGPIAIGGTMTAIGTLRSQASIGRQAAAAKPIDAVAGILAAPIDSVGAARTPAAKPIHDPLRRADHPRADTCVAYASSSRSRPGSSPY
jgi:prophage antirepressor-like protein